MCVTGRGVLPVARQHRFIHHRDEEGTSGVKESGKELKVSRVVNSLLAAFSRHREGGGRQKGREQSSIARQGSSWCSDSQGLTRHSGLLLQWADVKHNSHRKSHDVGRRGVQFVERLIAKGSFKLL